MAQPGLRSPSSRFFIGAWALVVLNESLFAAFAAPEAVVAEDP